MSTPEPVGRRDEEAERDEDGGGVATRQLEDEGGHVRRPRPARPQLQEAAQGRDVRQHLHGNEDFFTVASARTSPEATSLGAIHIQMFAKFWDFLLPSPL